MRLTFTRAAMLALLVCMLPLTSCDEQALPGTSECPPGTFGPYKCDGEDCGPLKAGCLFNQDGSKFAFVSCDLAPLVTLEEPTCNDTKMNGLETYIDCGGDCPVGCANTRPCLTHTDCASGCCNSEDICEDDTDEDGLCNSEDNEPETPREG